MYNTSKLISKMSNMEENTWSLCMGGCPHCYGEEDEDEDVNSEWGSFCLDDEDMEVEELENMLPPAIQDMPHPAIQDMPPPVVQDMEVEELEKMLPPAIQDMPPPVV